MRKEARSGAARGAGRALLAAVSLGNSISLTCPPRMQAGARLPAAPAGLGAPALLDQHAAGARGGRGSCRSGGRGRSAAPGRGNGGGSARSRRACWLAGQPQELISASGPLECAAERSTAFIPSQHLPCAPAAPAQAAARQREAALRAQLAGVRRDFGSRQRLLVRVLASRASEPGSQVSRAALLCCAWGVKCLLALSRTKPPCAC